MVSKKALIIQVIIIGIGVVFIVKLFMLQVVNTSYKDRAASNVVQARVDYPYRGIIKDRDGDLLVSNRPVYDLMVVPRKLNITGDIERFCTILGITRQEFDKKLDEARNYSPVKPSIFEDMISEKKFAKLQDLLVRFRGFFIQARTVRDYPHPVAANTLGYIGEIDSAQLSRLRHKNYKSGDYIGRSGIEKYYEEQLRGKKGIKYKLVNVRGVEKGSFKDGKYDTASVPGKNLTSSIDIDLQQYGEKLMQNKVGSIVAIEPSSGELLAIVSSPSYDPNRMSGAGLSKAHNQLQNDTLKPLFNRPLMSVYPPGSVFKTVQGLIAQDEGVIDSTTVFSCNKRIIACHNPNSFANLHTSIQHSCNSYYWHVFRELINRGYSDNRYKDAKKSYDKWRERVLDFGLGQELGIDLPNEKSGFVPTSHYYDQIYGEGRWAFSTIYSLAIGQGELGLTSIQLANVASVLANRGHYYIPHVIKGIGESNKPLPKFQEKQETGIKDRYFDHILDGMKAVVDKGTGYLIKSDEVQICGKTGTVENPHGDDHSVFICFAPKDNPKIALATIVENSGYGSQWAAPICGLMLAKHLDVELRNKALENYILSKDFIHKKETQKDNKKENH